VVCARTGVIVAGASVAGVVAAGAIAAGVLVAGASVAGVVVATAVFAAKAATGGGAPVLREGCDKTMLFLEIESRTWTIPQKISNKSTLRILFNWVTDYKYRTNMVIFFNSFVNAHVALYSQFCLTK
jgi:hypothetical protein